jgi:hypothetical protein
MPRLSCRSCGRQIYATSPLESLFGDERRCPRCGALLHEDRREAERRVTHRRMNPPQDPGPPKAKAKPKAVAPDLAGTAKTDAEARTHASDAASDAAPAETPEDGAERRVADRRAKRRRGGTTSRPGTSSNDSSGWRD